MLQDRNRTSRSTGCPLEPNRPFEPYHSQALFSQHALVIVMLLQCSSRVSRGVRQQLSRGSAAGAVQDERQYRPPQGSGELGDPNSTQFPLELGASQAAAQVATQAPARGPTSFANVVALAKQHTSGTGEALLVALPCSLHGVSMLLFS